MKNLNLYRYIPIVIIFIFIFVTAYQVINVCGGEYIYPLDDTYIHLAVAKNFAQNGVWGVTEYAFSSSSSSILYTLILSFSILIFGNNPILPLLLNIILSYFILNILFNILNPYIYINYGNTRQRINSGLILSGLVLMIAVFIPMVILVLSGMEHLLQILIFLLFIKALISFFDDDNKRNYIILLILSFFVTAVRYEGLFLIFITLFFFANRENYKKGILILLISLVPLLIFGLISYSNSWFPLPNSILLKGTKPKDMSLLNIALYPINWIIKLLKEPHLLSIFVASLGILWENIKSHSPLKSSKNIWLIYTLSLIVLHLTFAKTGWVYRYEAYIVAIGLIGIIINLSEIVKFGNLQLKRVVILLTLIIVFTCGERSYNSFKEVETMSVNIYEQQVQMAKFLQKYYNNSTIVLGDIGACTYFTNIKLIDLVSIGSIEPLKLRLKHKFNANEIEKLASEKDAEIAILYKDAFEEFIPNDWVEVASWRIPNNIGCYMDKVTFYSIKPEKSIYLIYNLSQFKKELPHEIEVLEK